MYRSSDKLYNNCTLQNPTRPRLYLRGVVMRICSILLLLSGLVVSTDLWVMFLDALTYGASVEFPQFFATFVNAYAQAFLTEYGMLFSVPLVCLAVVLVVVNFWNSAVPRVLRVLLPISMACTGFCLVLSARLDVYSSNIGASERALFIAGMLFTTVYAVLLMINTVHTFKKN